MGPKWKNWEGVYLDRRVWILMINEWVPFWIFQSLNFKVNVQVRPVKVQPVEELDVTNF
jgi:hypothetical protein